MPLKLIPPRDGKTPYWSIRGTYLGIYCDRSAKSDRRSIAAKALKAIEREIERGAFSGKGDQTFAWAAKQYIDAGGEEIYLAKIVRFFGHTKYKDIMQQDVDGCSIVLYPKASAATRNRQVYTPVCAVLKHAGSRIDLRRPKGSAGNKATAWLWPEQAEAIFAEAEKIDKEFAALLIVLCYTGMRLSEALGLTWDNVRLADGYAYIPDTKNGEPRAVFIPPVAVAAVANVERSASRHRVFRFAKSGHLYSLLRMAAIKAGVELAERSAFHCFRHTYATWMRRYAGADETSLIATGAWKDKKSVSRYTHAVVSEESKLAALLPTPKAKLA